MWARHGFDAGKAAAELGMTRQAVRYHVRRANAADPLTYGHGDAEDVKAMTAGLKSILRRVGIETP
jgi:hypothetical protein